MRRQTCEKKICTRVRFCAAAGCYIFIVQYSKLVQYQAPPPTTCFVPAARVRVLKFVSLQQGLHTGNGLVRVGWHRV